MPKDKTDSPASVTDDPTSDNARKDDAKATTDAVVPASAVTETSAKSEAVAEAASAEPVDVPAAKSELEPPASRSKLFPSVPRFKPAKAKLRDWLLTGIPGALLAAMMAHKGDVVTPRGDDPAHRLGHYASLIRSGHMPGGVIIGFVLVLLMTVGILGVMGDSPLDLRGDEDSPTLDPRPAWWKREGAWLVGFCVLLYVPLAGAYGLWDPWETHYSEVAREILARDDWITTWWGQEGWFMSKPILIFWLSALGMGVGSAFGLPFWRDQGPHTHEWFIRLPIIFLAIGAVYAVYRAVASAWGRRAGLLAGLVLATMPHFFFLAHQAMTDMPFVAPLIIAMAFLIMAVVADPEAIGKARTLRIFGLTLRISYWHLAVGAILMVSVPQIMYLLTRRMMFGCAEDADRSCQTVLEASRLGPIQFPIEQYWSGSAGNSAYKDVAATVPGSPAWEDRYNQVPFLHGIVQGLFWLGLAILLMFSFRKERRIQPLSFAMMYLFGAISFMGKGPAGVGVPEVVLLGFFITTGKWRLLPRIRFFQGWAIFFLCGMPWYIAIWGRLGNEFFDRFVVHDLLNRAFAGVHGDTGTFRYFVWQLGYAMFPWTGLVPAALIGWRLYVPSNATEAQKDVARLALLWFLVTFTLFSMMVTKFHHYIFPTVPSCAILVGLLLHRMLGDRKLQPTREGAFATVSVFAGMAMLVLGVTNFFGGWSGAVQHSAPWTPSPGNRPLGVVFLVLGLAAVVWSWMVSRKAEGPLEPADQAVAPTAPVDTVGSGYREARFGRAPLDAELTAMAKRFGTPALGAIGVGAAIILALIARDIGIVGSSRPAGFERFIHLFIYNYDRPFPTHSYDYHAILTGFGVISVLTAALLAVTGVRRHAVRMMLALSACFAVWGVDKYMIDLSNHWSQRNLFDRYYAIRHERETTGVGEDARYWADPIVAFQMNWKGENFYTGNHAAMLECGLPLCHERTPEWLRRHAGQRVFFVTEHSRSSSVIGQVTSAHGTAHTVTDEFDNNKFVLIEAQL